jgi:hypothetical protein
MAKSINPTVRAYQRTVFPSLSGIKGMAKDAKIGNRMIVVNQGKLAMFIALVN